MKPHAVSIVMSFMYHWFLGVYSPVRETLNNKSRWHDSSHRWSQKRETGQPEHIPLLKHGMPREGKGCQLPPPNSSHLGFAHPHRKLPLLLRLFPLLQVSFDDYLQRSSVLEKISADATELSDGSDSLADCNVAFLVPWVTSQRFRKKGVPCSIGYCHYAAQSGTVTKCSFFDNRVPMKLWEDTEACKTDWTGRSGLRFLSVRYPELCE